MEWSINVIIIITIIIIIITIIIIIIITIIIIIFTFINSFQHYGLILLDMVLSKKHFIREKALDL